jgi:hypothetical protein
MLHLLNNFGRPVEVSVSLGTRLGALGMVNQVGEYLDTGLQWRTGPAGICGSLRGTHHHAIAPAVKHGLMQGFAGCRVILGRIHC